MAACNRSVYDRLDAYCFVVSCFFSFSPSLSPFAFSSYNAGHYLKCAQPKNLSDVLFYAHHFNSRPILHYIWTREMWYSRYEFHGKGHCICSSCRLSTVVGNLWLLQNKYCRARKSRHRIHRSGYSYGEYFIFKWFMMEAVIDFLIGCNSEMQN